jgi:hypothetical protein
MAVSGDTAARPASATAPFPRTTTIKCLSEFTDAHGMQPFHMLDSVHAPDRCGQILTQASYLLSVLAAAYDGSKEDSEISLRSGSIIAGALEGIETLVNLANFLLDDVEGR